MSVACPQIEGIRYIKLDDEHWSTHTEQILPAPAGNPVAHNYNPGQFTGGTQPQSVGEPTSNYVPGGSTAPGKQAWQK